jgi:protein-disulfide isomerase
VRFGYFHFAFLGPESQWAGEASECAAEQNAFWEYHDTLFEVLMGGNQVNLSKDNLKQFAADMGLDSVAFDECVDSSKYSGTVQGESNAARQIGVQSTPTFLINGQALIGAQPFEIFQQVIEEQLANE